MCDASRALVFVVNDPPAALQTEADVYLLSGDAQDRASPEPTDSDLERRLMHSAAYTEEIRGWGVERHGA